MDNETTTDAGSSPVERPVRPAVEAFHNPWRTKLESCMVDGERLSYGEWQDLISETDDLYRYRCGQHDALNVAYANGRDDEREEARERVNGDAFRCIAPACKPLGCSDCNCAVPADVYAALGRSFGDAERERWERALKQTWQAIDPLKPAGQPGSYARGYDNGFAAALQVLRGNLGAPTPA